MARLTDEEHAAWNRLRVLNTISDSERQLLSHIESLEAEIAAHDAEVIEQCAIEAGERSPEGVSSHTMLGDMWDARIRALKGGSR